MNNTVKIILVLIIAILLFITGRCSVKKEIEKVEIQLPAIVGKSDTITKFIPKITHTDSIIFRDSIIRTENPIDKELADKFIKLQSDSDKVNAYLQSIQQREYSIPFEDSLIKITGNLKTQGELKSIQYDYELKPRKIVAEIASISPQKHMSIFVGAEVGGVLKNQSLNNFVAKGNLILQNKKGNKQYSISYDTDKRIFAGIAIKL